MAHDVEKDWVTKAGLRAVIIICKSGERKTHRCGYVAVPVGHPLHSVGYSEQADCITEDMTQVPLGKKSAILALTCTVGSDGDDKVRRSPDVAFDVHGGLTYAGGGKGYPADGDGWWFGFDCAHCDDGDIEPDSNRSWAREGVARSLEYVEAECESLAEQIITKTAVAA